MEEEDDEETIEVEEQQEGNDAESHRREIELLKEEGLLPLDQLLSTLNLPQVQTWRGSFSNKFRFLNTLQILPPILESNGSLASTVPESVYG